MPIDNIDLKGQSVASDNGQAEKTEIKEEETKVETEVETEESIDSLKERLKKVEEERDNYKTGMLSAKKDLKSFSLKPEDESEEKEKEEYPEWDENSKKFQEQTLEEAGKKAEAKAQAIIEKANERSAIAEFVAKHPEVAENWNEVIANYHPKNGKDTPQDIIKDLDRALIITRYEKGELNNLETEAEKRGEMKGKAEKEFLNGSTVSKTTSKTSKGESSISEGAIRLAKRLRVNPDKLALEDDSNTATINY